MVERGHHCFPVSIDYENFPPQCTHCGGIDHEQRNCRHLKKQDDLVKAKSKGHNENSKQEYRLNARTPNVPPTRNDKQVPLPNSVNAAQAVNATPIVNDKQVPVVNAALVNHSSVQAANELNKVVDQTITASVTLEPVVEAIGAEIREPLIEANTTVSPSLNLAAPMDGNPYAILVNKPFESAANKHIELIVDFVINESRENVIETSPSSHMKETSHSGNKTTDNTQELIVPSEIISGGLIPTSSPANS
jgi:hypothetical protein